MNNHPTGRICLYFNLTNGNSRISKSGNPSVGLSHYLLPIQPTNFLDRGLITNDGLPPLLLKFICKPSGFDRVNARFLRTNYSVLAVFRKRRCERSNGMKIATARRDINGGDIKNALLRPFTGIPKTRKEKDPQLNTWNTFPLTAAIPDIRQWASERSSLQQKTVWTTLSKVTMAPSLRTFPTGQRLGRHGDSTKLSVSHATN